ncbi:MAG TPA: hypothetical protein VEB22_03695 [Phycisphaerales bacterium]|nr:hypothetical protein [Phycisphaerales bacterium]
MRTVTFRSVLDGIAKSLGLDAANLQASDLVGHEEDINERVREGWEHEFWSELTPVERRAFRPDYAAGTAYTAGTEVYFPAADTYYQALRATTGNAPATESGGVWTVNAAYWAESKSTYSGDDWETGLAIAQGDTVRNPSDGEYYACHTAHTAGVTFDATKFGLLTPFARTIELDQTGETPIGEVKRVCRRDPRVYRQNPGELRWTTTESVIVVEAGSPSRVWVEFRLRPAVFTTTEHNIALDYSADDLVYLEDPGECYKALDDVPASSSSLPSDDTANWEKIDFPYILAAFVKRAVKADALRRDGQEAEADRLEALAREKLSQTDDVALVSQGQTFRASARTY